MPQTAIIQPQPATPQALPPSPAANDNTRPFSPHLEKAIAGRKEKEPGKSKDALEGATDTAPTTDQPAIDATNTDTLTTINQTDSDNQAENTFQSDNLVNLVIMLTMGQSLGQTVSNDQTDAPAIPALSQHLTNNSPLFEFLSKTFTSNNVNNNGQQVTSSQQSWQNYPEGGLFKTPIATAMGLAIAENESVPLAVESPEAKLENPLLLQLQKIIADSNESGKLSITVTGNTVKAHSGLNSLQTAVQTVTFATEPLPRATTSVNFSEIADDSPMVVLPNGSEIPNEKPSLNLTSLRHSIQQQYFDAKIDSKNNQENQTASEGNQQSN